MNYDHVIIQCDHGFDGIVHALMCLCLLLTSGFPF
ncbi:hypothetical protein BVRB_3g066120 [Beta vulgaris subsp. vulgaris]|nr:hypothetical protein BVRB_3g066120 [Beta vulgaris subsp. vulgaris]